VRLARWLLLLSCAVAAACSSAETPAAAPTLTLIPATATNTPTPVPPTATLDARAHPEELFPTATPSLVEETPEALIDIDPIAAELVTIAQRDVAENLDLPMRRVQLVDLEGFVWEDSSLGCPLPNQTYTRIESFGYRIVVSAGNEEYIYHTDFDRVLPCDPDNEQLPIELTPEATLEATEEMTSEATPEASEEAE
jgi:hypothetical protein